VIFFFLGPAVMSLTFLADCWYFWKNNFRNKGLKTIVVKRDPSTLQQPMLKKMNLLSQKYLFKKVGAILSQDYVCKFRDDLDINSLLQFLIFG
jgi:hypothetical protein